MATPPPETGAEHAPPQNNPFECLICMDTAHNAVVTQCGHMYCWECLREWLQQQHTCPVCKSAVTPESVIPIYNSSDGETTDGPPRPSGHYTEPPPPPPRQPGFFPMGPMAFGGVYVNGIPLMPLFGGMRNRERRELTPEEQRSMRWQSIFGVLIVFLPLFLRLVSLLL